MLQLALLNIVNSIYLYIHFKNYCFVPHFYIFTNQSLQMSIVNEYLVEMKCNVLMKDDIVPRAFIYYIRMLCAFSLVIWKFKCDLSTNKDSVPTMCLELCQMCDLDMMMLLPFKLRMISQTTWIFKQFSKVCYLT